MLPFAWYMLKVIICSGILFGYYWFFLRNKIFHQYNRFYLLGAMSLSLLLPLLKINIWQPDSTQNQAIRVLQAVSAGDEYMNNIVITAQKSTWSFEQLYTMVYWLVCIIFFFVLIRTLYLIRSLLKKYPVQQIEQVSFVNTNDDTTPFSFLKYIFWNSSIDINTTTGRQIFKHEVAHIQEKHTYDKLFVNIILIFCWCNPFFWLYRKELNMIHEFIADKKAVEDSDTSAFAAMILQAAYPRHRFELTNNFFYSPIKRRLLMLTKIDNPRISYFARLMVLPLAVLIFAAFTFKAKNNSASLYHGKKITVVIDAGHGGKDAGAISADGIFEKDLTLAIAKKVKELNGNDAIEIVLVRDGDVYMNPQQKVEFAKSKNADLLISFHIDNSPTGSANNKTGMSVFVAKDEFANAVESKILASAIINEFSNNYGLPVMPKPNQRQMGIQILQANTCPSVLVEAGFINNEKDIAYLQTEAAKETIAKNVLQAIEKFASMDKTVPQILQKEKLSQKIKDTVPDNTPINPEKALLIANGKIIGKGKKAWEDFNNLVAPSVSVKWLKRTEAIAKYGNDGADGACEVNYKEGAVFTTAFVDADKMSVFYIGINNPFSVSVPNVKPEDLVVNMSQGSKSGSNGNYIAHVTSIGELTITLSKRDGTKIPASFTVKVKRLPDPSDPDFPHELKEKLNNSTTGIKYTDSEPKIFIGNFKGGRISLDYLKTQKELKLSPGYSFVSATLYFSFPHLDKVSMINITSKSLLSVESLINSCVSGSTIMFDKVYIKDNNGEIKMVLNPPGFMIFDNKITDQELQNLKQKLLLDEQNKEKLDIEIKQAPVNDLNIATNKLILQEKELQARTNNMVFTQVEVNPQFTGGEEAWKKYLRENIKPVTPVDEGWKAGKYTITVKFIVYTDGTVSDITTENYKGSKTAQHCIDVIKQAPKWQPAVQNGRKVNAYKKQPITFVIEE